MVSDWLWQVRDRKEFGCFPDRSYLGNNVYGSALYQLRNKEEKKGFGHFILLSLFPVCQRRVQDNRKVRRNHSPVSLCLYVQVGSSFRVSPATFLSSLANKLE